MNDEKPDLKAPEGARCSAHPDRPAGHVCSRCGSYACGECWHADIEICSACLGRDPRLQHRRPPHFENESLPLLPRLLFTMRDAFRPYATALSFLKARVGHAVRFAIITAVPLSALAGIIPHTQTLLFKPGLEVESIHKPGSPDPVTDIAIAMLVQLLFDAATLLSLGLPFVTLTRSYASKGGTDPALSVILYRAWLLPAASLLSYLLFWVSPEPSIAAVMMLVLSTGAFVLFTFALWANARQVSEISTGLSLVVLGVSWMVAIMVSMVVGPALSEAFGLPDPGAFGIEGQNI
jgi:hypothetical protein